MGLEKRNIGITGERIAMAFLEQKGYEILGVNVRTYFGELDIVAKQKNLTIFVEVKTRLTSSLGPPFLSVTGLKQRHLVKSATSYMKRFGRLDSDWRIDVVSVKLNSRYEPESIELIENAVTENNY